MFLIFIIIFTDIITIIKCSDENGDEEWFTAYDQFTRNTYKSFSAVWKSIFKQAGFPTAQLYTIRKSAAKWMARCGAHQWEILNAGILFKLC